MSKQREHLAPTNRVVNLQAYVVRHSRVLALFATAFVLVADYLSGPVVHFPILFLIPLVLVAWAGNRRLSLVLAVMMALIRLGFVWVWKEPLPLSAEIVNTIINMTVFALFAVLVDAVAKHQREMVAEVRVLEGLLPICAFCKKIRNDDQQWESLEGFISKRSEATFSHGFCPECGAKHYGDYLGSDAAAR